MRCSSRCVAACDAFGGRVRLAGAALAVVLSASFAWSEPVEQQGAAQRATIRATKEHVRLRAGPDKLVTANSIPTLVVSTNGRIREYIEAEDRGSVAGAGVCGEVTYTDPGNFEGGIFNIQLGFGENEAAIASYEVDPVDYPIRIESMECVFAQDAVVETETWWRVIIWDGPPRPEYVHSLYDSDNVILPHLMMPAGRRGTNIKVVVDPEDPSQIILQNDSGMNVFSVGFVIMKHNEPLQDPCEPLDPDDIYYKSNAFPTTDADGVASLTGNWLSALNCGTLCDGTNQFEDLFFFCRPSGDWVIRATYECSLSGPCCDVDAACMDVVDRTVCQQQGGTFMGADVTCPQVTCPTPNGACCASGICLDNVEQDTCESLPNAVYMGNGTPCDDMLCALGACCMGDGSCEDVMEVECDAAGGAFEGGGSECASTDCPEPRGSCCIAGICVQNQAQGNCEALGVWNGQSSTCDPDPCRPGCPDVAIVDANPPSGTIDARQPHEPDSGSLPSGIGSLSEPILITLGVEGAEGCFSLCETAPHPVLGANDIADVTDLGGGNYEIVLLRAITPGAVTTIRNEGSGEFIDYRSHPANANGDGLADSKDITLLVEVLNGTAVPPHGLYSVDINRSGTATGADVLRLIDVLNGADALDAWNGTPLPANTSCPVSKSGTQ